MTELQGQDTTPPENPFASLLDTLDQHLLPKDKVTLGEIIDVVGLRGHGPLITLIAVLMILPTGVIPLMPAFGGLTLILCGFALLIGDERITLPARARRVELPTRPICRVLPSLRGTAHRLARVIRPRGLWILRLWGLKALIAVMLFVVGAVLIVLGSIPGLPFVLCLPVLLLGLGMTAGDAVTTGISVLSVLGAIFYLST